MYGIDPGRDLVVNICMIGGKYISWINGYSLGREDAIAHYLVGVGT